MNLLALLLCASVGSVADVQAQLGAVLEGRDATVADVQRSLATTLGWSAASRSGVIVSAPEAVVRDLDAAETAAAIAGDAEVWSAFAVSARGPRPYRVYVPLNQKLRGPPEVYRVLEDGLTLRVPAVRWGKGLRFETTHPGRFAVIVNTAAPALPSAAKAPPEQEAFPPPDWALVRVAADEMAGPIPLLLIHGVTNDRWANFIHWSRFSDEAAPLRERFQLWNFRHNMAGRNYAIGFDPTNASYDATITYALASFLETARTEGTLDAAGERQYWPEGPFAIIAHSHGVLKTRALLCNHPEIAADAACVISLSGVHTGAPGVTMEWALHTFSRMGPAAPNILEVFTETFFDGRLFEPNNQSWLDMGWLNLDAAGGQGIPHVRFDTWDATQGRHTRVLSPRDANQLHARALPYPDDTTFIPQAPLPQRCGALDQITPSQRGELYSDRFYLYGSYIHAGPDDVRSILSAGGVLEPAFINLIENIGLRVSGRAMALTRSAGSDWPLGIYQMNDGFVPLQSQLLLDGRQDGYIFETHTRHGWTWPKRPLQHNMEKLRAHTLGDPEKLRVLPGWSHLDTVTGRYDRHTGHSPLFLQVQDDLLAAIE